MPRGATSGLKPELGQTFVDKQISNRNRLETKTGIGAYFSVHKGMSKVENAVAGMALFDGTESRISDAIDAIDAFHSAALDAADIEFLTPLVGVSVDPFAARANHPQPWIIAYESEFDGLRFAAHQRRFFPVFLYLCLAGRNQAVALATWSSKCIGASI